MADDALNAVDPAGRSARATPGDVPERIRRRYLTDDRTGPGLGYYVDAQVSAAAFRDHGRRLSTDRTDPNVIRDLIAIAEHRGWQAISVRGQTAFRREAWLVARQSGLEVVGYRPTARDLQDLERRTERRHREAGARERSDGRLTPQRLGPDTRLRIVESVVRARIVEPAVQARVLATARARLAQWLERPVRAPTPTRRAPSRPDRDR